MVIGLTGGSGCGKSTALAVLRELGARCFDADAVYHELLRTDRGLLAAIEAVFPGTVNEDGLDRKKLGARVFGDPEALSRLNEITHPRVLAAIRAQLGGGLAAIDAFGLIEGGLAALCDHTVAILAPREARIARLTARDGITADYAARRIDAQKSDEEFSASCEFTLCNNGTQAEFEAECREFFRKLIQKRQPTNI